MSEMGGVEVGVIDLTEIVEDWEQACDYADGNHLFCPGDAAKWVGFVRCETCGYNSVRLLCPPCQGVVTTTEGGCFCPLCNEVVVPYRRAFVRFEPLDPRA